MSLLSTDEATRRFSEFRILFRYMSFLQQHGFSEYGKGQLTGKMELLQDYFSNFPSDDPILECDVNNGHLPRENRTDSQGKLSQVKKPYDGQSDNSDNVRGAPTDTTRSSELEKDPRKVQSATIANTEKVHIQDREHFSENIGRNIKSYNGPSWMAKIRKLTEMDEYT
jgi:hypothetical protein